MIKMPELSQYEYECYQKFIAVLRAASLNPSTRSGIELKTEGTNPYCSATIPGYVIERFTFTENDMNISD